MAGFLQKDKRLIDYKLTEFGRDKLSEGSLDLTYYTFSDASIVYNQDEKSEKSFKVADNKLSYLPFEVDTNVGNIINPEYTLSSMISFDDLDRNILFVNKETNRTLSDSLSNLKLIDNKNLVSKDDNREISFDYKFEPETGDFLFQNSLTYSTIHKAKTNLRNIDYISKDKRFSEKTRNKFLPPTNSFKDLDNDINESPLSSRQIEVLFKSLNTEQKLPDFVDRKSFIVDILNIVEKDENVFRLEYVLNEDKSIDEDVYLFEIHKIVGNNLQKFSFIDLGEFYDEKEFTFKRVFLIGKIFLTRNIKDEINEENLRKRFSINNDYSFVNMFTLVIE